MKSSIRKFAHKMKSRKISNSRRGADLPDSAFSLEGYIESVENSQIIGWVWDIGRPAEQLEIEFLENDRVLGFCRADIFRQDLLDAGKGDGRHMFLFETPLELRDGREHALTLRVRGANAIFTNISSRSYSEIFGEIQLFNLREVRGSIRAPTGFLHKIEVELLSNGVVLANTITDDLNRFSLEVSLDVLRPAMIKAGNFIDFEVRALGRVLGGKKFQLQRNEKAGLVWQFDACDERSIDGTFALLSSPVVGREFKLAVGTCLEQIISPADIFQIKIDLRDENISDGQHDIIISFSDDSNFVLQTIHSRRFHIDVDVFDDNAVDGTFALLSSPVVGREFKLAVGTCLEQIISPADIFQIKIDLRDENISDGQHDIIISFSDDSNFVLQTIHSRRFHIDVDVFDDNAVIFFHDKWGRPGDVAIEIILDGKPVAIEVARSTGEEGEDGISVSVPISRKWRDGKPHQVQARIAGEAELWPERPVLFQAGTPDRNLFYRIERRGLGLSGFALPAWVPNKHVKVELLHKGECIHSLFADQSHPALAAETLLPANHGFSFELHDRVDGELDVRFLLGETEILRHAVPTAASPGCLEAAGYGRQGLCFLLPDALDNAAEREECRHLLLAAVSVLRANEGAVTLVFSGHRHIPAGGMIDVYPLVVDLVGAANAELLKQASWINLPKSVLPSSTAGMQERAYAFDLFLRSHVFSAAVGTSRGGVLAYAATSAKQGLLPGGTRIIQLVDTTAIRDQLDCDLLLDRPELLADEALERAAIRECDALIACTEDAIQICDEVVPGSGRRVILTPLNGTPDVAPIPVNTEGRQWLTFASPLRTASGLVWFCDALDRLSRRASVEPTKVGILIVGPEDLVRGRKASEYLRQRAEKWPFALRLHSGLTFDSTSAVLSGYGEAAIAVTLPPHRGTVWEALTDESGLYKADLSSVRRNNATDLSDALEAALSLSERGSASQSTQPDSGSFGRIIAQAARGPLRPSLDVTTGYDWPAVTLCITHFNRPSLLRQTIASVRACQYPNLEVIVVDDGSRAIGIDEELTLLEAELTEMNGRLIRQKNSYLGAARNRALRDARADLFILMDDDNIAHPEMIHAFVATHLRCGAEIVTSRFAKFEGTDVVQPGSDIPSEIAVPHMPDMAMGVLSNCFGDANMLITREAFDKVGGFTEDFGRGHEDWELLARASTLRLNMELLNQPCFWYRVAAQSMLRARESVHVDLQRNIRAYSHILPPEIYRVVLLAQGLTQRWSRPADKAHMSAHPGVSLAHRLAYGRVAVIMRTKDRPILLARAMDSVINQSFTDWTLVIVNDGGASAPVEELIQERKKALQGRYLLINNPVSTGMENASNSGIVNSASEFIVIHDDDDAWDKDFLSACVSHLQNVAPEVAGVVTQTTVVIEDIDGNQVIERNRFPFQNIEAIDLVKLTMENQFPPISFLFRRVAMEQVGAFDGTLPVLGDWDFHLRLARSFQINVLNRPLAFYHHRTAGTSNQYGNTVVAQRDTHRINRSLYLNRNLRAGLSESEQSGADMLFIGELSRCMRDEVAAIREHMHHLEKVLKDQRIHTKYIEDLILDKIKKNV